MTLNFGGVQVSSPAQPLTRLPFFWSAHDGQKMCEYDNRLRGEIGAKRRVRGTLRESEPV
jgi:hypothetical protein